MLTSIIIYGIRWVDAKGCQLVEILYNPIVVWVQAIVANIKLRLTKQWIIQKETAAEIIYGLFGAGKKLVGYECHLIPCLSEELREERIVAPCALVAHTMQREDVLKHKTGEVPRSHHISESSEIAPFLPFQLARCGGQRIIVKLRVMAVVTLTYHQDYIGACIRATVYGHLVYALNESVSLLRCQHVGIDAKCQPVDRQIVHRLMVASEGMLHLANVMACP